MNLTMSTIKSFSVGNGDMFYICHNVYAGCSRRWLNESDNKRDPAGINFLWPDINSSEFKTALADANQGKAYNNISPIFTYSVKSGVTVMWMGDLEHDFLESIADKVAWPEIDILFAPHHGRDSGKVPEGILKKLKPRIIVVGEAPPKDLNYYEGYNTITQLSAGDIVFDGNCSRTDVYVSDPNYSVDYLENDKKSDSSLGHYIGSFTPKAAS